MDVDIFRVYTSVLCSSVANVFILVKGAIELSKELEIIGMIKTILKNQSMRETEVEISSELYDDGIGLDSLCVAELSAMLEKAYGSDPYTSNAMPRTVSDIVSFYGNA